MKTNYTFFDSPLDYVARLSPLCMVERGERPLADVGVSGLKNTTYFLFGK